MADANDALLIDPAIQQVRSISYLLHAPLLDGIDLQLPLQLYREGFTQRSGIEVVLDRQPSNGPRLASELETAIARRKSRADCKLIGKKANVQVSEYVQARRHPLELLQG